MGPKHVVCLYTRSCPTAQGTVLSTLLCDQSQLNEPMSVAASSLTVPVAAAAEAGSIWSRQDSNPYLLLYRSLAHRCCAILCRRCRHALVFCEVCARLHKCCNSYFCMMPCRTCIAAFVDTMLQGGTKPGVWFPEEPEAIADRLRLLQQASQGCIRFELNQPPWKIESDAKQVGMGFYW